MDMQLLEKGLSAVEEAMVAIVDSDVNVLYDASEHILSSGGKRVRPRVAFLAYLAAGGSEIEQVVPMATAVEMVHTATLVHDDINDHSVLRRGRPTVHSIWGRTFALLTGDYLFAKVYQMMAPYGSRQNVIMSNACTRLVEGETLQATAAKAGEMDQETYKEVISRKTASLFEAAARMGAIQAGADEPLENALADYAYNLGLTFQIVDDILDIIGDPETMGKPIGTDISQGRGVVVAQNGHATELVAEAVLEPNSVEQMINDLRESGAVQLARFQAQRVAQRAREALTAVPPSPARDEMEDLIEQVLNRDS
ncbi:MAG: polyprenyl synthetase family protein [Anaerolineales bacterium]|nr:polyprenyl synthetase family protein [Anaerolineales bacterium]